MAVFCKRIAWALSFIFFLPWMQGNAMAGGYPEKPIRLVVGYSAGGGTDLITRLIGNELSARLGQSVVVENRPGAHTVIATDLIAKADPDGYTLGVVPTPIVTNPSLFDNLPYDTSKDFTWITQLTEGSLILVLSNSVPAGSVQELIELAKSQPGKLTFATGGAGGSPHLAAVLFEQLAGVEMLHIPYKGASAAMTDLISGRVSMMFSDASQIAPHIQSGSVKPIAVTAERRSLVFPDLPTIAETGLDSYGVPVWYGLIGPANMPNELVQKLNVEVQEVLKSDAVAKQLENWGVVAVGSSPSEFASFIHGEREKWAAAIKARNVTID